MRNLKYPITARIADAFGNGSGIHARVYALEKWAYRHGYKGYTRHIRKRAADKKLQEKLNLK